jgi:hypothetical protein
MRGDIVEEVVHKQDRPDSIEIGTPGKGGALKVYFNAARLEEAVQLVENAHTLLRRTRSMIEGDGYA